VRYSDFVLRIEPASQGVYPVIVQQSPQGDGRGTFRIPFTAGESHPEVFFRSGGPGRDTGPPASQRGLTPREAGNRLFSALFSGTVGELFDKSVSSLARAGDLGLRVRLLLDPQVSGPDLLRLPWELLCWTAQRDFLALNRKSPIVRSLSLPRPLLSLYVAAPLRILVAVANANDLDLQRERQSLEEACGSIPDIDLQFLEDATLEAIWERLRDSPPFHVLHYMGHGGFNPATGEGGLGRAGDRFSASGSALAQLIVKDNPSLRLAFLNGCHTARSSSQDDGDPFGGVAPALLLAGLPAVVAMQYRVSDKAAIAFAKTFYSRLAFGEPVEVAVSDGRQAVLAADPRGSEWATPVLFLRSANGRLFRPSKKGARDHDLLRVYLRWTVERLGKVVPAGATHLKGIAAVRLASVFTPLRCRQLDWVGLIPESLRTSRIEAKTDLPGALAPFGYEGPFVLLGGAGSGKTTLLQWLSYQHAWARLNRQTHLRVAASHADPDAGEAALREIDLGPARIPIFIPLVAYNAARRSAPALSLNAFLGHHLGPGMTEVGGSLGAALNLGKLHKRLLDALEQGDALVLLDGLDQISNLQERSEVAHEINLFLDDWLSDSSSPFGRTCGPQVAITSRPADYEATSLGQVSRWLLEPLDSPTFNRLSKAWRRALGDGENPAGMPARAPSLQEFGSLSINPRFATWLAVLATRGSLAVPNRRVQLYETVLTLETEDWQCHSRLPSDRDLILKALSEWAAGAISGSLKLEGVLQRFLPEEIANRASSRLSGNIWPPIGWPATPPRLPEGSWNVSGMPAGRIPSYWRSEK
jgi:hypothetical protein